MRDRILNAIRLNQTVGLFDDYVECAIMGVSLARYAQMRFALRILLHIIPMNIDFFFDHNRWRERHWHIAEKTMIQLNILRAMPCGCRPPYKAIGEVRPWRP